MSELYQLIDKVSKKTVDTLGVLKSTPAIVRGKTGNKYNVEMLSNGSVYTVMNLSGCRLIEGQLCQIYYKGELSQRNCYIGAASSYSQKNTVLVFEEESTIPSEEYTKIYSLTFSGSINSYALIALNLCLEGMETGTTNIRILANGNIIWQAKQSVAVGEYENITSVIPFLLTSDVCEIEVYATGQSSVDSSNCYVYGEELTPLSRTFTLDVSLLDRNDILG